MKRGVQNLRRHREFRSPQLTVLLFLFIPLAAPTQTVHAEDRKSSKRNTELSSNPAPFPYLQRGDRIAAQYQTYAERQATFHEKLRNRLSQEAPDLLTQLPKEPQKSIPYGYQIVPKLVPAKPSSKPYPRVTSTSYSWPRTERMLNGERRKLDKLERQLQDIPTHPPSTRYSQYDQVVKQYVKQEKNQRLVDRHIKHNRFWQKAIHDDKIRFDR